MLKRLRWLQGGELDEEGVQKFSPNDNIINGVSEGYIYSLDKERMVIFTRRKIINSKENR